MAGIARSARAGSSHAWPSTRSETSTATSHGADMMRCECAMERRLLGAPAGVKKWPPVTSPASRRAAGSLAAQQCRFNGFRDEFNQERPPARCPRSADTGSMLRPLPREMPAQLPSPEYPDRFEVRCVSGNGSIRWWNGCWVNVSTV